MKKDCLDSSHVNLTLIHSIIYFLNIKACKKHIGSMHEFEARQVQRHLQSVIGAISSLPRKAWNAEK